MQYRFLGTATLVMVTVCVSRMTFGRVHPRGLCACRAKRICSRFPVGFTYVPLAAARAEGGGRHLAPSPSSPVSLEANPTDVIVAARHRCQRQTRKALALRANCAVHLLYAVVDTPHGRNAGNTNVDFTVSRSSDARNAELHVAHGFDSHPTFLRKRQRELPDGHSLARRRRRRPPRRQTRSRQTFPNRVLRERDLSLPLEVPFLGIVNVRVECHSREEFIHHRIANHIEGFENMFIERYPAQKEHIRAEFERAVDKYGAALLGPSPYGRVKMMNDSVVSKMIDTMRGARWPLG